jgi:hypothetical protein
MHLADSYGGHKLKSEAHASETSSETLSEAWTNDIQACLEWPHMHDLSDARYRHYQPDIGYEERFEDSLSTYNEDVPSSWASPSPVPVTAPEAYFVVAYGMHEHEAMCEMMAGHSCTMRQGDATSDYRQHDCAESPEPRSATPSRPFGSRTSSETSSETLSDDCATDFQARQTWPGAASDHLVCSGPDFTGASTGSNLNCTEAEAKERAVEAEEMSSASMCYCWRLCRRLPDVESYWVPTQSIQCGDFTSKAQSAFFRAAMEACRDLPCHMSVHTTVANACGWRFEYKSAGGGTEAPPGSKLLKVYERIAVRRLKAAVAKFAQDSPFALYTVVVEGEGKILLEARRARRGSD